MIENDEEQKRQLLEELKKKEMGLAKEEGTPVETETPDDYEPSETVKDIDKTLNKFKTITDPDSRTQFEKDVDKWGDNINDFHHEMELDMNPAKWAYMSMWGALDVPFDVIGAVPGLGGIDDTWDQVTGFKNEGAKNFRSAASVIVPSIVSGGAYAKYHAARNLTGINGAAQWVGGQMLINGAIGAVSDYGEDPTNRLITHPDNFARLSKAMPWMFGPQGWFPTISDLADADATHPYVNRLLAGLDEGLLQGFGDLVGYGINAGKPILSKILPKSRKSKAWKAKEVIESLEKDTRNAIVDLDTAINSGGLKPEQVKALEVKKAQLLDQATKTGSSEATKNPAESWLKTRQKERQLYRDQRALKKIAKDPMIQQFDPDIAQKLADERNLA